MRSKLGLIYTLVYLLIIFVLKVILTILGSTQCLVLPQDMAEET